MSFSDIAKKIGKTIKSAGIGVDDLEDMASIPKKNIGRIFEKVDPDDAEKWTEKVFGVKVKKSAGIIGTVGVGAYAVGSGLMAQNRIDSVGEVRGGELANTTSGSRSPNLQRDIEEMQNNEEFANAYMEENFSRTQGGVEPGLVFALHELRN